MSILSSFTKNPNVVVVGAAGGIGSALVAQIRQFADPANVLAFSRNGSQPGESAMDIESEASIQQGADFASSFGPLDLVVIATGVLHDGEEMYPEKSLSQLRSASLEKSLSVNTIGPAMIAKHFLPLMRSKGKTVFSALSARVGSISDNRMGGWASYRASKAALNMLIKTFAIEQSRRFPDRVVVTLHPGTVETSLSKPFTKNYSLDKLFSPTRAANQLLNVLNDLEPSSSGDAIAWDGSRIGY